MVLALYIGAAWFTTGMVMSAVRRDRRKEFAFLLLFFMTISTHVYNIIDDNFGFISIAKDPVLYSVYLIYRSVLVPTVLTGFSAFLEGKKRWIGFLAGASLLALVDHWTASLGAFTYHSWSPWHAAAYYLLLQLAGAAALAGFRRLRD